MKDEYMDIRSPQGTKVVFTACGGMDGDIEHAKKKLVVGEIYTIRKTVVHDWITDVYLEGFPCAVFNSCLFNKCVKEKPNESEQEETIKEISHELNELYKINANNVKKIEQLKKIQKEDNELLLKYREEYGKVKEVIREAYMYTKDEVYEEILKKGL